MKHQHLERFFEFLVVGVLLGVVEDLIAVKLITGQPIDLRMIGIIVAVAIPFAAISELVVDRKDFVELLGLQSLEKKLFESSK